MNPSAMVKKRLIEKILASRKYKHSGLNPGTVGDLIDHESARVSSEKELLKAVRRKLHNIVAPYLGEPNYQEYTEKLNGIKDLSLSSLELREFCLDVLREHASTAERIPFIDTFYRDLFHQTGYPAIILDLACGLHPLAFPWMGLPLSTQYHAYDIIQPRINFINIFFEKIGLEPLAENRDILVDPPQVNADLGIFFKEAHRFEKREPGCNQPFWESLLVGTLAVSLPRSDLAGSHSLVEYHRRLVYENSPVGSNTTELEFPNELVFLIKNKPGDPHAYK